MNLSQCLRAKHWSLASGMRVRVVDREAFGRGRGVQFGVGRHENRVREPSRSPTRSQIEERRELHGIVAT
jgi:hypothetical protein